MKHQHIDTKARVWTVTLGPDGKLQSELDPRLTTPSPQEWRR